MFATWKFNPETKEVQSIRQAYDPETARSSQHQACNRCHEKKLKCSGDKDGCDRCASQGLNCEYSRSGSRHSRRGKKNGDRLSPCSSRSGRDGSLSPASMASQPSSSSKSKRSRTSTAQRARASVTESRPRTVPSHDNMVNHGEYTIVPEQGTYNLNMLAATTASITPGYPATSLGTFSPPHGGSYQDEWMVSSTGTTPGYLATAGTSVYASSEGSYPDYPQYEGYNSYQGTDPRYWGHGPHGHLQSDAEPYFNTAEAF